MSHAGFNYPNAVLDYRLEMARGKVPNSAVFGKFGARSDIDADSIEDIWCGTVTPRVDLVSAERMEVVSTNASDNSTSLAGANSALVFGVDNDWNEIFESVALSGTNPSVTTQAFLRVNFVITSATGGNGNVGIIAIAGEVTGSLQDIIEIGEGYSCSTHYAVPKGKRVVIPNIQASVKKNDEAELIFKVRSVAGSDSYIDAFKMYLHQGTTSADNLLFSFDEMTDIKFQVEAITQHVAVNCFYTIMQFPAD